MIRMMQAAACAAVVVAWGSQAFAGGPIQGNTGKYMSPFTSDGTTAGWITKSMQVKAAGQIGSMAGQYAGQKAMEQVPLIGGFLGKKAGEKLGREVALKSIGGEEFLRSTSDLSFETPQDLADYVKANFSDRQDLPKILQATYSIYPDVEAAWPNARRPVNFGKPLTAQAPAAAAFDLYKITGKAGHTITVAVEADTMQPRASLSTGLNAKELGGMAAPKGAKQVSFNVTIPSDGEYLLAVSPVSGVFKSNTGGAYVLKVSDPVLEQEEADRLAAQKAAAARAAQIAAAAEAPAARPHKAAARKKK